MPKTLSDPVPQLLKNLEAHADAIMRVPSSEQYLGNMQAITSVFMLDVKRLLEVLFTHPNLRDEVIEKILGEKDTRP